MSRSLALTSVSRKPSLISSTATSAIRSLAASVETACDRRFISVNKRVEEVRRQLIRQINMAPGDKLFFERRF